MSNTLRMRTLVPTLLLALCGLSCGVHAEVVAPDALIQQISTEVIDTVKSDKAIQSGDVGRVIALVDNKVMPNVNFQRMTAASVGRFWRDATPEQKQRLQVEFKILLVRTYAGALSQVKDQVVELRPFRGGAADAEVVGRTQIKGKGEPIQLDYRLEKTEAGWKIYDVNVLGVWLVDQYRSSFAQEIGVSGIDGLISKLAEKNKAAATKA